MPDDSRHPSAHWPTTAKGASNPYQRARVQADGNRRCGQPLPTYVRAGGRQQTPPGRAMPMSARTGRRQQTGADAGSPWRRARGPVQTLPTRARRQTGARTGIPCRPARARLANHCLHADGSRKAPVQASPASLRAHLADHYRRARAGLGRTLPTHAREQAKGSKWAREQATFADVRARALADQCRRARAPGASALPTCAAHLGRPLPTWARWCRRQQTLAGNILPTCSRALDIRRLDVDGEQGHGHERRVPDDEGYGRPDRGARVGFSLFDARDHLFRYVTLTLKGSRSARRSMPWVQEEGLCPASNSRNK
ncbi:UNVERIFIED_CONTAM: hypothetical protein Sindi_2496700 [Sesamum indicum]